MDDSKNQKNYIHGFQDDALAKADAVALAESLRKNKVSAKELAEAAMKRAQQVEPAIHAIACSASGAHSSASHTGASGFFRGIPTFVKDNIAVKGLPTQFGSAAISPKIERKDSPYSRQFLTLGMTVLGKSTLPEFGFNATTEPAHCAPTRNPWHLDYSAGASSGGSAALVAAGVVPFAHGNDGGGSIRIPAACCGLVGLKPSRNRHINEFAARALPINIVSEGIVSRSVRDTACYHFEMQKYYRNPNLPVLPLISHPDKKRLKIGLYTDSITGYSTDNETRESVLTCAALLESLGHQVEEIKFPVTASFGEDFSLYWGMLSFMVKRAAKVTLGKSFNPNALDNLSQGLAKHYARNILKTPAFISRLKQQGYLFRSQFEHYDACLSPVVSQTTRPLGDLHPDTEYELLFERLMRYASFTPMANIAGTPAISLPMGRTLQGLPIGIQLSADMGQEQTLLELAFELENANPWINLYDL